MDIEYLSQICKWQYSKESNVLCEGIRIQRDLISKFEYIGNQGCSPCIQLGSKGSEMSLGEDLEVQEQAHNIYLQTLKQRLPAV